MNRIGRFTKLLAIAVVVISAFLSVNRANAGAKESAIVRFSGADGEQPVSGLIADAKGNLYGATTSGGRTNCAPRGCGVVFQLSPGSNGSWTQKIIYAFKGDVVGDTDIPVTDLIFDTKGNLFGATGPDSAGFDGAVYELTPGTGSAWTEKIIYRFTEQSDYYPGAHLAFDSQGNLYGTVADGSNIYGGVFELSPQSDGTWSESTIYSFTGESNGDGNHPVGGVVLDSKGNVYGMTQTGGAFNFGTVYELSPNGRGGWSETIIYNFMEQGDGAYPFAPLTIDANGNLFGTTLGGDSNYPDVFELSHSGTGWNETVLYAFGTSGYAPSGVAFDSAGDLYGTTVYNGTGCNVPGCGIAYELTPQGSGPWQQTILHNFESAGDGSQSMAGVLVDSATGRVYGTTEYGGGRYGYGTVFEILP